MPILTDHDITALLRAWAVGCGQPGILDRTVFLGRRDEVVLRLLLDTGVRVSEPCGLEWTDLDQDREPAYVTGKGLPPADRAVRRRTASAVDRCLRVRALHPYARSLRLLLGQRGPMPPDGARRARRPVTAELAAEPRPWGQRQVNARDRSTIRAPATSSACAQRGTADVLAGGAVLR